jgi:hypothetical protein
MNLQIVSKMFAQILGVAHIITKDKEFISVCAQTLNFLGKPPTFAQHQSFRFLSVGTLKNVIY